METDPDLLLLPEHALSWDFVPRVLVKLYLVAVACLSVLSPVRGSEEAEVASFLLSIVHRAPS